MPEFITNNLATIIILGLLLSICALIVWRLIRAHKRGTCMGCPAGKSKETSGCLECPYHLAYSDQMQTKQQSAEHETPND